MKALQIFYTVQRNRATQPTVKQLDERNWWGDITAPRGDD
jgi:hypothetical protein